ncbi:T9SS type A sorting domain-containing protein [Winogradskyella luteola]|uniref:T9SS type A sorting domain-containing protein n=1 Tax=Winogradskyella luteola TaxID=2828330 RepID=A0A9X1F6K8_9FLAO|nr:T9SS type A sorting domain-containing protein [Winogradskyella luteola]MBV7268199.1 T9SS type A sorting domain-containing protein [Winogradskyella luteola]
MKRTLLILLLIIYTTATVKSQTVWSAKNTVDADTGNNPYTIASGLIDGDSNLDILVGTDEDNIIVWYKGNGDGTFVKQTAVANTIVNVVGLKLIDLNTDGDLDILAVGFGNYAAGYGQNSKLVWFENDGNGTFGAEQLITDVYDGMSGVFAGTIDGDATIDIAVTSLVGSEVIWFPNNGSGVFGSAVSIDLTLNSPAVINMKDIDSDGDLDAVIATANYATDVIEIFRNNLVPSGTATFTKDATSVATGKKGIFNATFEDLDGDSNLDILATEVSCGAFCGNTPGNLFWYEDNGSGFTETTFTTTITNPSVAQFIDIDEDGVNDIILSSGTSGGGNDLVWFKNNGSGSFDGETVIDATQSQAFVYSVNDFDDDGDMDIASCAYNEDDLNYFENLFETLDVDNLDFSSIKIFPNPTKDVLNFEGFTSSTIKVSIFDLQGKRILKQSHNTDELLDVSGLANGLYTININSTFASKFIKE